MQPSYPLPSTEKARLRCMAVEIIKKYAKESHTIIITHYHYDHHIRVNDDCLKGINIYKNKIIYLKNPNVYINASQWKRARLFIEELLAEHNESLVKYMIKPVYRKYRDPVENLKYIHSRDYGDYTRRREELLAKGKKWFMSLTLLWKTNPWIRDNITIGETKILWAEGRSITNGRTSIIIGKPCFHGIEYDRTGWVTPLLIRNKGYRIVYTSDLMGPIIEDYAYMIIDYEPDIVIVDGPPTYLYPYMFNRINLERALDNLITIIDHKPELIVYDHHLLRDPQWRIRVKRVLDYGKKAKVKILTASEAIGKKPLIDEITGKQ